MNVLKHEMFLLAQQKRSRRITETRDVLPKKRCKVTFQKTRTQNIYE